MSYHCINVLFMVDVVCAPSCGLVICGVGPVICIPCE
jgi:hypothetical protein